MDGSLSVNPLSVKKLISAKNDCIHDIFYVLGVFGDGESIGMVEVDPRWPLISNFLSVNY